MTSLFIQAEHLGDWGLSIDQFLSDELFSIDENLVCDVATARELSGNVKLAKGVHYTCMYTTCIDVAMTQW